MPTTDRFQEWIDASGEDRSELHCRDTATGEEVSRPDGPRARQFVGEWKAAQLQKGRVAA